MFVPSSKSASMPIVRWTDEALADLEEIADYIAARNPFAAVRLQELIERAAEQLAAHPYIHRPGRISDTREAVVHPNYILVYRVGDVIEIVSVLHARQQYP